MKMLPSPECIPFHPAPAVSCGTLRSAAEQRPACLAFREVESKVHEVVNVEAELKVNLLCWSGRS